MAAGCEYGKEYSLRLCTNEEMLRTVECQCCSLLKNELRILVNELRSMTEITDILKEELKYDNATKQDRLLISACEGKPKISALGCDKCSQLDNQLKVTLNELSSVKLIMEILNEEIKILKQTSSANLNPDNTWGTAKPSTSRSSTTDRQPKEVHGIYTQYMPITVNRFEILSDLNEDGNRSKSAEGPRGYPRHQHNKRRLYSPWSTSELNREIQIGPTYCPSPNQNIHK
jgi:hypothetical protein